MLNKKRMSPSKSVYMTLFIFCLVALIAGCRGKNSKKALPELPTKSTIAAQPKLHFIKIDTALLASKKDLVCYMPLWTGIGDTCTYKGKIYGFCSKDCKDDFLKNPK